MANILVLGAGIGGMSAAYELRALLDKSHSIQVVGEGAWFAFTPSNPWVAVGWRTSVDITVDAESALRRKNIGFYGAGAARVFPQENRVELRDGKSLSYDYLVVATGPRLAFDEVPGLGPEGGFTQSICTTPHAATAWDAYQRFLENPGPIVVGAITDAMGSLSFALNVSAAMLALGAVLSAFQRKVRRA